MHGYLSNKESFNAIRFNLSRSFSLYSFDFKGFGENAEMEYPYSLSDYADEVKDFCKSKNLTRPFVLAHSFGARVVFKIAKERPDFFSKVVLVGPAGIKPRFSLKKAVKKKTFDFLKRFVKREKLSAFYSKDYISLSPIMKKSFVLVTRENLDEGIKRLSVPTLILVGKRDKETPVYMGRKLNKMIKNSELKVLRGAGHFAFLDRPKQVCEYITEFCKE